MLWIQNHIWKPLQRPQRYPQDAFLSPFPQPVKLQMETAPLVFFLLSCSTTPSFFSAPAPQGHSLCHLPHSTPCTLTPLWAKRTPLLLSGTCWYCNGVPRPDQDLRGEIKAFSCMQTPWAWLLDGNMEPVQVGHTRTWRSSDADRSDASYIFGGKIMAPNKFLEPFSLKILLSLGPKWFSLPQCSIGPGEKGERRPPIPLPKQWGQDMFCHWMERSWRCRLATDRSRESCDPWAREGNVQHTNRNAHAQGSTSLWIINITIRAASYLLLWAHPHHL